MQQWDEVKLVRQSCRGNRQAYGVLVDRYARYIFGVCLSATGHPADAEDLAQEIFMKGFQKIRELHDATRFGAWLLQICRRRCADYLRDQQRQRARQSLAGEVKPPEDRSAQWQRLDRSIGQLSEKLREPLILYYLDGKDTQSVARILGITPAGVLTRLSRARQRLRELLNQEQNHE